MPAPRPVPSPRGTDGAAPPEGWCTGPPDYVGVGTAASGAAWWHSLIVQHPQVAPPHGGPMALHAFEDGWLREPDETDLERYHGMFAHPPGTVAGEWTPDYLHQAWTPPLLRRAAPETRLLVMLRDPVERFHLDAATPTPRSGSGPTPRAAANAAFGRGLYADQLLGLWRAFSRDQVLVLQLERCIMDTRAQLQHTLEFLGLALADIDGIDLTGQAEAVAVEDRVLSEWQLEQLARHYAPENAHLAALLPDLDLSLWRAPQ